MARGSEIPRRRAARRRPRQGINDRQSFIDILGTVLQYVLIVILIMLIVRYAREAYAIGYGAFSEEAMDAEGEGHEVTVEIKDGMSVSEIGQLLEKDGLIKDARVFPLQERLSSYHGKLAPGTYTLTSDMTPDEILKALAQDSSEGEDGSSALSTAQAAQ